MKWDKLSDGRTCLPEGTVLLLEGAGGWYRITGSPIGFGGSGIIYPAVRVKRDETGWTDEEMNLAVKECYPSVPGGVLRRDDAGRILGEDNTIYHFALDQMRKEKSVTGIIYNSGFRLVPVWTSSEREQIALDGEHFEEAENYYAVMERLDEKGRSLEDLVCKEKLTAKDIFSLGCQLLRALKEVHKSGYIHGDIQTNNIFIKGFTAGDDLGVLSLLDFGAARRLEADNRTAPIEDRAIYTTKGFSAPECMTRNDGTLRLSPAADLYSAGCVLLRMLSGKHISPQALELVTNGRYIYSRQAVKLRCPAFAAEAINRFLDKALKKEPENRYQSAEEMLRDAARIEQSLAPANIAISTSEYAAFISYCHSEKTKLAAQKLADAIEHYNIPRYASESVGNNGKRKRKIGKVFLDRMELSGGGDMGEQIVHALENSAYLIVILGGGSERSEWVSREIEGFLKTHTRDRVLTVLAEGNEKDAMPEILKTQEFFTEEGKKILPIESLSADLRADSEKDINRLLKTEKLRLLAPMLGCSFDDLKQREKEANTRRLIRSLSVGMAIFAVIALIVGYLAFQINNQNIQLLKTHAKELAEQSGRSLENGDREQALSLALEALTGPSGEQDMPVCAEAKAALQNALYLYRDFNNLTMAKKATRIMKMGRNAAPGLEMLSPNGLRLLTRGVDGSVFVWDLLTGKCIAGPDDKHQNELSRGVLFAGFLDDDQLLVIKKDVAIRYPISDSDEKDTAAPEIIASDIELFQMNAWSDDTLLLGTFNSDRSRIALCRYSHAGIIEDGVRRVIPELVVCDTDTMRCTERLACSEDPTTALFGLGYALTASGPVFSQDGRWAALPLTDLFKGDDPDRIAGALLLVDTEGSESRMITDPDHGFLCCQFTETDSLIVYGYTPVTMWDVQEMPLSGAASCIDLTTGTKQWETRIENQTMMGKDPLGMFLQDDMVVLWGNRQIQCLDKSDGKQLRTMQVRNGIAGVYISAYGAVIMGDRRGNLIVVDTVNGVVSGIRNSIDCSVDHFWYTFSIQNGGMIVSDSAQGNYILLESSANTADMVITLESEMEKYYACMNSAYMLIECNSGTLTALDLRTGEWRGDYPSDISYSFAGTEQVFANDRRDNNTQILQLLDLSSVKVLMQKEIDASVKILFSGFCCGWQTEEQFFLLNESGETVIDLPEEMTEKKGFKITDMVISDNMRFLYLFGGRETELYGLYDLKQQKWLPLPSWANAIESVEDLTISPDGSAVAWLNRETAAVSIFYAGETEARMEIPVLSTQNFHAAFGTDNLELYCIANNGYLQVFDTRTGSLKAQSRELYTYVYSLSVNHENSTVMLDAIAAEDDLVQGIYSTVSMHVLWLYEKTTEGTLYRMAGADNAFYSDAAQRMVSVDPEGKRIFLYDHGADQLNGLISKARELLSE